MAGPSNQAFSIHEHVDAVGIRHVELIGEVDIAVADRVEAGLLALRSDGRPVELDLSLMTFLDCRGLRAILIAVGDSRGGSGRLTVDPELRPAVRRLIEITGTAADLWPRPAFPSSTPATRIRMRRSAPVRRSHRRLGV